MAEDLAGICASNQLVAALALFVLSCWLLSKKKTAKFTLWPAFFMFATTVTALLFQLNKYLAQKDTVLSLITASLIVLAGFMIMEVVSALRRRNV